ncbi:MAG TPA: hypothetical protein VHE79_00260, partial [Spirochaetia bacterium]
MKRPAAKKRAAKKSPTKKSAPKQRPSSVLSHVGVFSLLSTREIGLITEHMATVALTSGQTLFHEGDEGDNL